MNNPLGAQAESNRNGTPPGMDVTGTTPQGTDETLAGLPIDTVEVVEVVEIDGDVDSDMLGDFDTGAGPSFQWWWVPAALVPVIAGGAGIWYLTRGKQDFLDAYDVITRRGNDFVDMARNQAKNLPGQSSNIKGKSAAVIGGMGAASMANRVGDRVGDWWDDMVDAAGDLFDRGNTQEAMSNARDAARNQLAKVAAKGTAKGASKATAQVAQSKWNDFTDMMSDWGDVAGDTVNGWVSGLTDRQTSGAMKDTAKGATKQATQNVKANAKDLGDQLKQSTAKAAAKTAAKGTAVMASSKANTATDKTAHAMKKTGKSVNSAWKRTRTFTFAMLVTAMVTYLRAWRQRMGERTMRETAGGRMVPDTQPTFR